MQLETLALRQDARITTIDWSHMAMDEAQRLRSLGFEEGALVRIAHRGIFFGRDPLAVEIGRMTVAIRRSHARAMAVELVAA